MKLNRFFFPIVLFQLYTGRGCTDSHWLTARFDYTVNSPYTTIDTHCCTISLLWFFSTLTCSNFGQYKHSVFVENKHFMYTSKDLSHIHTPQNDNKWMVSQLQATADLNKQYLAWGKSNETRGVKQSWMSIKGICLIYCTLYTDC